MVAGEDIPLGTAWPGRTDEALDDMVGFFVNTLVLRTDLSGNPTFRELLDRVREFDLAAYANQDVPFEVLVDALRPTRAQDHHPLFQTMLVLQNQESAEIDLPGITVGRQPVHTGISKFDLTFSFTETRDQDTGLGGIEGSLEFSSDVFGVGVWGCWWSGWWGCWVWWWLMRGCGWGRLMCWVWVVVRGCWGWVVVWVLGWGGVGAGVVWFGGGSVSWGGCGGGWGGGVVVCGVGCAVGCGGGVLVGCGVGVGDVVGLALPGSVGLVVAMLVC
ncbi:hypothetical protein GXW82_07010 [Streptacidiphilus sp. 4-A2]|nr:hypothetical protein [Streptacidiphilus sp. 4-A2]